MSIKAKSKLADIRKEAGLTQAKLAVLVGVTPNTIQNWEKEDGLSQLEKYLKLGAIFGLDNLQDLFEYVEISEDEQPRKKEFSIQELQELSERWGTKTTDIEITSNPNKKPETKSLENLQELIGTEETAQTNIENDDVESSKSRRAKS